MSAHTGAVVSPLCQNAPCVSHGLGQPRQLEYSRKDNPSRRVDELTTPRRTPFALSVPRQYGAWSILIASYLIGVTCVDAWSPASLVLLVAVVGGFMGRHAATAGARLGADDARRGGVWLWAGGYALAAGVAGGALLFGFDHWRLVPLGIAVAHFVGFSVVLERKRLDKTLFGELLGTVGLALVVPATAYVSTGVLDLHTWALWSLAAGYFAAAVFHVRYLTRHRHERTGSPAARLRAGAASLVCHLTVLAVAVALSLAGWLPRLAPVALLPALARAAWAVGHRAESTLIVRRLGWSEVAQTVAFIVLAIAVFHTGG